MKSKLASLVAAALLASCSAGATAGSPGGATAIVPPARPNTSSVSGGKIQHVIVLVQENRSFDNLFATYPGAYGALYGNADVNGKETRIPLVVHPLAQALDLQHSHNAFVAEYDGGKNDGWPLVGDKYNQGLQAYQRVNPADIVPYWQMAQQYALADHMFSTFTDGSFTAHQEIIAATTALNAQESMAGTPSAFPWGCDAPKGTVTSLLLADGTYEYNQGPFPCMNYPTIATLLDAAKISWRSYAVVKQFGWNGFEAIRAVRAGPDWNNVVTPETQILVDARNGNLPAVSYVSPRIEWSDHPGSSIGALQGIGPYWVAQLVNAVGEGPQWNSTAIVVVWDDWGGFYDHVPPPQPDYATLAFRVPMLVISPYARKGYVSHTQYEFGSVLKFIEQNWGLGNLKSVGSLYATDARAASIADCFDFTQTPRTFTPFASRVPRSFFLNADPKNANLDDRD